MTDSYLPLEGNLVNSIVGENLSFSTKEVASLFDSFNTIWKLEYTALLGAVIIMIIIGGVVRQGGGVSSIRKSNEIWRHAVLGLLAGIGIYLIAATFNPNLLRGDVDLSAFESKGVGSGTKGVVPFVLKTPPLEQKDVPLASEAIREDPIIRAKLKAVNITVNKPVCSSPDKTSCTTVGGWPPSTVAMLLQLRSICDQGTIEVTGGTEAGHFTHGPGKTPVDISINKAGTDLVNKCIRTFPKGPSYGFCYKTYTGLGYIFCDEAPPNPPHWHIFQPSN